MNVVITKLLLNALWQIPLCAAAGWCAARLLRRWPAVWSATTWRLATHLAAVLPVATALWTPAPLTSALRITVNAAAPALVQPNANAIPWLTLAYFAFTAVMAVRLLRRWLALRQLNEENVTTPSAFGWRTPRVIIPRTFTEQAPPVACRAALLHENTHIQHADFAHQLLLEIATLPVAFHPVLHWLKTATANAVEMRCDESAARAMGDAKQYALGLIEAARLLGSRPAPCLTVNFFDHNSFEERIMNLTQPKSQPRPGRRLAAVAVLTAAALSVAGLSVSFAAQEDKKVYKIEKGIIPPKVLQKSEPPYPNGQTETGTVLLMVEIAPNGKAENIQVKRGLLPPFDESAVESVKTWRFQPGTKDGTPVRVLANIEVNFQRK